MHNLLLYVTVLKTLVLESSGHGTLLQTQALIDIARDWASNATSATQITTPVPQVEQISAAYWREVKEKLYATHKQSQAFLTTTPKPTLDPWADHQPYFTWLGDAILKDTTAIRTPPTETPPPSQEFVNNVQWPSCPEVRIPMKVRVEVPPCSAATGYWLDPLKNLEPILTVDGMGCGDVSLTEPLRPNTSQTDTVGTLHHEVTLEGSIYDFKDCNGNPSFSVSELIIRQGVEDSQRRDSASDEFGLPHRTKIFLKYSIAAPNGAIIGETNIFPLGEDYFWWHHGNATGRVANPSRAAASAQRVGFWKPKQCGNWTKAWTLHFNSTEIHGNSVGEVHWRLALTSAMTILAWRDEQRSADGLVRTHKLCAVETAVVFWVLLCFGIFIPCAIFLWFWIKGAREVRDYCFQLESWLMPHHMAKPSKSFKY